MGAIYKNMLNSLDRGITMGTCPVTLWSAPVVGYRAAAADFDRAGGERSRHERRGLAFVSPEGLLIERAFTTQLEFDELFRLSRGARGWISFPNNTSFLDGGNDPPSRYRPHSWYILKSMQVEMAEEGSMEPLDGSDYFPLEQKGGSAIQPAPARLVNPDERVGRRGLMHLDREPDPEGRNVGRNPLLVQLGAAGQGQNVQAAGGRQLGRPVQASFWFKPERVGSMSLMDVGRSRSDRDRLHLYMDRGELVLEVLDTAGIDPDPAGLAPPRSAASIRLNLSEYPVHADLWYHFGLQCLGCAPERLTLLVDGVPRGRHDFMSRLTATIPVLDHRDEMDRYLDIQVEDASSFPPQGVVRIGTELFEYTSRSAKTLHCRRGDSRGGRDVRHSSWEWNTEDRNAPDEGEVVRPVPAPEHQPGEAVALYGYSIALKEGTVVPVGDWSLPTQVGAWGVARMVNTDTSISVGNRSLGEGIDEKHQGDLELASPATTGSSGGSDFMGGFQKEGGLALLGQRMLVIQTGLVGGGGGQPQETKVVGGLVAISYTGVEGNKLTGVRYGVQVPILSDADLTPAGMSGAVGGLPGLPGYFDGQMRPFVGKWADKQMEEKVGNWAFVVPISLKLVGDLTLLPDPSKTGHSEYVQILPKRQVDTEWVRYDAILGDLVIRSNPWAVRRMLEALGIFNVGQAQTTAWPPAVIQEAMQQEIEAARGATEIGYIPQGTLPLNYWAAYRFRFRGPRETRTSTHAHGADALVLPVFRVEERWGPTASLHGRPGRKDRVALVEGNEELQGNRAPAVEWHTLNWSVRLHSPGQRDPYIPAKNGQCNLVALSEGVRGLFSRRETRGARRGTTGTNRQQVNPYDLRELTRIVKFPSGEMPWRFTTRVHFGMPQSGDRGWPADGLIDEVEVGELNRTVNGVGYQAMLALPLGDKGAASVQLLDRVVVPGLTVGLGNRVARFFPRYGGLVQVGDEILAFREVTEDGRLVLAEEGRGLLGTEPGSHGIWDQVTILERPAATTLTQDVDAGAPILAVDNCRRFPKDRGLVLIGRELVHYVYSRQYLSMEMPARQRPPGAVEENRTVAAEEEDPRLRLGDGIFRGRFGTSPESHSGGCPVIAFPFRYWDRHAEKADAPEMHHFDIHLRSPRAFFAGVTWEEEVPNAMVDLRLLARVGRQADWRHDPQTAPGLYLFDQPTVEERPNRIGRQGNELFLRFFTVYESGAFDPVQFLAQEWKQVPVVRNIRIYYEAPTVILQEKEVTR